MQGFPFLRSLEARKARRYKWGAYCRTNWRCTAILYRQVVGVGVSETLPNERRHLLMPERHLLRIRCRWVHHEVRLVLLGEEIKHFRPVHEPGHRAHSAAHFEENKTNPVLLFFDLFENTKENLENTKDFSYLTNP